MPDILRIRAMAKDYKQYNYPYFPYAGETIAAAGCGPTACSDILEIDPTVTAEWMEANGWAVPYQGTIYEGIAACLTHFGANGKMLASGLDGQTENPYFDAWKESIKSGYEGILLMHAVVSTYWTTGGHYIAIVGYQDGQYLVYDPASDFRTGWHPWEDFAGDVAAVYTSTNRWKESDKYMFEVSQIQEGDHGDDVYLMQSLLRGRGYRDKQEKKAIVVDSDFGPSTKRALMNFQEVQHLSVDGICGPATWKKLLKR